MKVYTIALPALPDPLYFPEKAGEFARFVGSRKGLVGIHPYFDDERAATILVFRSLDDARTAAMQSSEHYDVANYIMNAELDDKKQNLQINGPAERWKGGPVS